MVTMEEPILPRIYRLENLLRHLEELRGWSNRALVLSPKSSCASTPSSGTLTSDGRASSTFDSPTKKHCRPVDDVMSETQQKGTLLQRIHFLEDRVLKMGMQLEQEMEAEKNRAAVVPVLQSNKEVQRKNNPTKKKKGLKQLVKSCVGGNYKSKSKSKQIL